MDLTDLVKQCQHGNMEAFNELYRLYNVKAVRTVYLVSGRKSIAEDIVQESFIQCFLGIGSLHKPEKFNSWFYSILVRNTWKMVSKNKSTLSLDDAFEGNSYCESKVNAEEALEAKELHCTIQKCLDNLSIPMKTTVILYYYDDMSVNEISKVLGCFEGTVKSRLHSARKLIKKELEKNLEDGSYKTIFPEKECNNHG